MRFDCRTQCSKFLLLIQWYFIVFETSWPTSIYEKQTIKVTAILFVTVLFSIFIKPLS
jgi:hypothetical protein